MGMFCVSNSTFRLALKPKFRLIYANDCAHLVFEFAQSATSRVVVLGFGGQIEGDALLLALLVRFLVGWGRGSIAEIDQVGHHAARRSHASIGGNRRSIFAWVDRRGRSPFVT